MPATNASPAAAATGFDLMAEFMAMKKEIQGLRKEVDAANKLVEIQRSCQEVLIGEFAHELKRFRKHVKTTKGNFDGMERHFSVMMQRIKTLEALTRGAPTPSPTSSQPSSRASTPSPNMPPRGRASAPSDPKPRPLRREGAVYDLNDIDTATWDRFEDVRGYNPDAPRYYYASPDTTIPATSSFEAYDEDVLIDAITNKHFSPIATAIGNVNGDRRKRSRDEDEDASTNSTPQADTGTSTTPSKRRKTSSDERPEANAPSRPFPRRRSASYDMPPPPVPAHVLAAAATAVAPASAAPATAVNTAAQNETTSTSFLYNVVGVVSAVLSH